jgi:hypothetical protein
MARTTSDAVQAILLADYDSVNRPDLTPFIDTASAVVNRVAVCCLTKNKPLTATELELVERWLAAHCYCMSDQPYRSRKTEKAEGVFQGNSGMNLDATKYGQTANMIDYSGCLAAIAKKRLVKILWLGKYPTEQIDYVEKD